MILKRFFDDTLAQASYLVACQQTGQAIIIDPNRDIDSYIEAAQYEHVKIVAVTETHIHADYVSGSRELANRVGATLFLSAEGGKDWSYEFTGEANVKLLHDGDQFDIGQVRFEVIHTPGHTPEHLIFVVTDLATSPEPCCVFTGDFIFVGDVGRPDLLEKAAGISGTMEAGARDLYRSLQKVQALQSHLMIWPGHGAGSACGKALGSLPATTLGYERATNWAFKVKSENQFADEVLHGQPEPPGYFARMKRVNKLGPDFVGGPLKLQHLQDSLATSVVDRGALILDVRPMEVAVKGFLPGSINVPPDRSFSTYAGSVLPGDEPIYLVAENEAQAAKAAHDLRLIGYDDVPGWFGPEALASFAQSSGRLQTYEEITTGELNKAEVVLDVRKATEREEERIPGSTHIPLSALRQRASELPKEARIAVHCGGGVRSVVGVTLMKTLGFENPINLIDGMWAYRQTDLPIERGAETEPVTK